MAAGAIVTKDVPPYAIVAGIPAKTIGQRNHDLRYIFKGQYIPFYNTINHYESSNYTRMVSNCWGV